MLARSFKSAVELGISEQDRDALIKVLGMLERGEFVASDFNNAKIPNGFNMDRCFVKTECGTVGCILGWARHHGARLFVDNLTDDLLDLFMFDGEVRSSTRPWLSNRKAVTPANAAYALSNYLTTGKPSWAEVRAT